MFVTSRYIKIEETTASRVIVLLSKRKEHFRFSFGTPLPTLLRIIKVSGQLENKPILSSFGNAEILDISPGGIKLQSVFEIPIDKPAYLELSFTLNEAALTLIGQIVWRQQQAKYYHYGITLLATTDEKQYIINELKIYSKRNLSQRN